MQTIINFFTLLPNIAGTIQARDIFDILIVSIVVYLAIVFIKQSRSYFIFYVVVATLVISYLAKLFNLSLTRQILQPLLTFFLFIFVVVFQREIRRFLEWFSMHARKISLERKISLSGEMAQKIVDAVFQMAEKRTGAIIVFAGDYPLDNFLEGGFPLDGRISRAVLFSIFDTSSAGHDGAVIIDNNRIKKFGVHLPLAKAEGYENFKTSGTRHRATAGITERTDAMAIVVSEERGTVSLSEGGKLRVISSPEELEKEIKKFMKEEIESETKTGWDLLLRENLLIKIASIVLAAALWFIFVYQTGVITQDFSVPMEFRYAPENIAVDQVVPKTVKVTLSGNYSDIHNLELKDIKLFADLKDFKEGWQTIELTKQNISYPNYLDLIDIAPTKISVDLKRAGN